MYEIGDCIGIGNLETFSRSLECGVKLWDESACKSFASVGVNLTTSRLRRANDGDSNERVGSMHSMYE